MIVTAPTAAQIPVIRNDNGGLSHSDTYSLNYGQTVNPAIEADPIAEALADAVDARNTLCRWTRHGNTAGWRKASRTAMQAVSRYADLAGMTRTDAAAKVQEISEMFPRRR